MFRNEMLSKTQNKIIDGKYPTPSQSGALDHLCRTCKRGFCEPVLFPCMHKRIDIRRILC